VVTRKRSGESAIVLAIGEAKSTTTRVGAAELRRLEHLRTLVPADRVAAPPRLLLFSRNGFTAELRRAAGTRADVELVDLHRLYKGS
jgi:hypothetical protein